MEAELIEKYQSRNPEFGYNLAIGQPRKRVSAQTRKAYDQPQTSGARAVRCVETGETFPSLNALAKFLEIDKTSLRKQIRLKQRCRGYHWEYYDAG